MNEQLTAEDIKHTREKYGLSQQAFARLLGIGEASMVRYESGKSPSKANAHLIRAAANPSFMLDCLNRDKNDISEKQRQKTEQIIYSIIELDKEDESMNINDVYMLTLEQEILNEQAAQILADVTRFYFAAEEAGDEARRVIYEDILQQISHAKRQIIKQENMEKTKLAEIKGEIKALKELAQAINAKVA